MNKFLMKLTLLGSLLAVVLPATLEAQTILPDKRVTERGTSDFRKIGILRGNQVRTVFSNWGVIAQPGNQGPRGAWKYDTNGYVGDVSPVVGVRLPIADYPVNGVKDGVTDTIVSVVITPVDRPGGGDFAPGGGKAWTFEPIPGFANPTLNEIGKGVAMSHQPETWPDVWPDKLGDQKYTGNPIIVNGIDVTPKSKWNGYFGMVNVEELNADQEAYFWMDDNNDEKMFSTYGFLSDTNDVARRGQALQMSVRGLQWRNFLAQDVIFWLYNIKNDGTVNYDQATFGTIVGTYVGGDGDEWNDDVSFFNVREAITYTWDFNNDARKSAVPRWQPNPNTIGYIAYAFLESPGNATDGLDNDGDNKNFAGAAPYLNESSFSKKNLAVNDKLVLITIDAQGNYNRAPYTVVAGPQTVTSMGKIFNLTPGTTVLSEGEADVTGLLNPNALDGFDNDLDGIIDENYLVNYRQLKKSGNITLIDTLVPVQYKDFVNSVGLTDKMIDERRDDGIDNDGDWNITFDDFNGDGIPTDGEPNFDKTDIDESDMLGLTSFDYFVPSNAVKMNNEPEMWGRLKPGYFAVPTSIVNNVAIKGEDGDFIYGSGYFPLLSGRTERFSLALAYGDNYQGVLKTKQVAQLIYNANYNFPKPPTKPTLTVVPGDKRVTLYWDRVSEASIDPTLRVNDFEGYKIYKGTDQDFTDALTISDGTGKAVFLEPLAQFDLNNGVKGYFLPQSSVLYELSSAAPFYLGNETGIQNSFVDTDVLNGRTYFYAVVGYDRGDATKDVYPSENTRFIALSQDGTYSTDINTAVVVPNAPVLGYVPPANGTELARVSGNSDGGVVYAVMDPRAVKNSTYEVSFADSTYLGIPFASTYTVTNKSTGQVVLNAQKGITPTNGVVFDGVYLSFNTSYQSYDSIKANTSKSGWNNQADLSKFRYGLLDKSGTFVGVKLPYDYYFVFSDTPSDSSYYMPNILGPGAPKTRPSFFKIIQDVPGVGKSDVKFTHIPVRDTIKDLRNLDRVFIANPDGSSLGWIMNIFVDSGYVRQPKAGDTLKIITTKPMFSADKFTFTPTPAQYNSQSIAAQLDKIQPVPNPYIVTNVFETPLPPQVRGRGERVINFTNVPASAKISIYTVAGDLVRTLQNDSELFDGAVQWDLRTSEGLDIAYGVYFYVVEIPGVSDTKVGKLAIIK